MELEFESRRPSSEWRGEKGDVSQELEPPENWEEAQGKEVMKPRVGCHQSPELVSCQPCSFPPSSLQLDEGIKCGGLAGVGGRMSYLLTALIIFKATRLSLNLTRIEAGASASGFGLVHARARCIWPTWGFRSQRKQSRLGSVSTSGDLKSMVPCGLYHLLGPGTFKLMISLCKCQVFWVAEEKVSKMHMENVVGQTLHPFATDFKENWVQSKLTCPGHLMHGVRPRTEI